MWSDKIIFILVLFIMVENLPKMVFDGTREVITDTVWTSNVQELIRPCMKGFKARCRY